MAIGMWDRVKGCVKYLGFATLGFAQLASAKSIGTVAQGMSSNFNYLGIAIQGFFALCGLVCLGISIFTFIKYNKTDGNGAKLSTGFI